jgi:8-oxo-dGTP pyrophosphatase MutT (NUDIX family)
MHLNRFYPLQTLDVEPENERDTNRRSTLQGGVKPSPTASPRGSPDSPRRPETRSPSGSGISRVSRSRSSSESPTSSSGDEEERSGELGRLLTSPRTPFTYEDRIPLPFLTEADQREYLQILTRIPGMPERKRIRYSHPMRASVSLKILESYAIVLVSRARGDDCPAILLGRRRETIEFANFIRGLYDPGELHAILSLMTRGEREKLLTCRFEELWADYWPLNATIFHACKARHVALTAYERVQPHLVRLLQLTRSTHEQTEWLFPRGRGKRGAQGEEIARREFQEETQLSLADARRTGLLPYRELYYGSDGLTYATTHYVYEIDVETLPAKREAPGALRPWMVSNDFDTVSWMTLSELRTHLNTHRFRMVESSLASLRASSSSSSWCSSSSPPMGSGSVTPSAPSSLPSSPVIERLPEPVAERQQTFSHKI